jgi:hypothetical protein
VGGSTAVKRTTILRTLVGVILAVLVTGCDIKPMITEPIGHAIQVASNGPVLPVSRPTDALRQQYYSTWPSPIRDAVDKHIILVGMDKVQAQVSLDILEAKIQKDLITSSNGISEMWHVWKFPEFWSATRPGDYEVLILFRDGKVASVHRGQ